MGNALLLTTGTFRTLANYLGWRMTSSLVHSMPMSYRLAAEPLRKVLTGTTSDEVLWSTCVDHTDDVLGLATGALFVQKQFGAEDKEQVLLREI